MMLDKEWISETCNECGTVFALKLKEKLHEEKTPYQTIEIFATQTFGNLMVIDGCFMLSSRDNFLYHEMMAHPVLYTHVDPKDVLIIGGGDCGTLREVLKHQEIEHVQQVEIDERVTRLSEQFFSELCESNNDSRAELHFTDGIKWVNDSEPDSYDVIIVDSTDPVGPAEGLFTEKFYRDCHRALRAGGILVQQSESPLVHMRILKAMYTAMTAAGYLDVHTLQFPQCVYPTGWWSATMAGKGKSLNEFRETDAKEKPFETIYYNADIHRAALAMPEFFARQFGKLTLK
jgi:spermidine synthase